MACSVRRTPSAPPAPPTGPGRGRAPPASATGDHDELNRGAGMEPEPVGEDEPALAELHGPRVFGAVARDQLVLARGDATHVTRGGDGLRRAPGFAVATCRNDSTSIRSRAPSDLSCSRSCSDARSRAAYVVQFGSGS